MSHADSKQQQRMELGNPGYCMGCNAKFEADAQTGLCPRCRARLSEAGNPALDETILVRPRSGLRDTDSLRKLSLDTAARELIGHRVNVYLCESLLGVGGMGRVYLALHTELGRRCALKLLSPRHGAVDEAYINRFLEEGRAAAALVHPNIVTTHAIGQAGEHHFIEMEFVAGRSLQQLVDDEGRLTPLRAMTLTSQICEGLAMAHAKGIIHRDLKPDNVLLTRRGIAKISDFGLAKRIIKADSGGITERLCGTPHFMAPELLQGENASPSSDVYALGVCLYLLLTGRLPYTAESLADLQTQLLTRPLPSVRDIEPSVSLEIAECVAVLLEKSRENRPRDATEAVQLLHAVLGEMRDIDSLLLEAFSEDSRVTWNRVGEEYHLTVSLPEGRKQNLIVESSHDPVAAERLLLIYSVCCDACPEYYEQALRLNGVIRHGSLAIREIDSTAKFVAIDTYPRATVDVEELKCSVLDVACHADAVERLLTGLDRH